MINRSVLLALLFVAASPLLGEDAKPAAAPAPDPKPTVIVLPAPPAPHDSPLVAAAKRTKRSGKKVVVITNDTLSKEGTSKARITTTTTPRTYDVYESDQMRAANYAIVAEREKKIADEAKKAKLAKDQADRKQKAIESASQVENQGPYSDDPAMAEHQMEEAAKRNALPQTPPKPPQF